MATYATRHPPTVSQLVERLRRIARPIVASVLQDGGGTADMERDLRAWLATDTVLRDALAAEGLERFVHDAVQWCESRTGPSHQVDPARALLDFRIGQGLALRDATRREVVAASTEHFGRAKEHLLVAKWLKAVAQELPDEDVTVATVLTEKQLLNLRWRASQFGLAARTEPTAWVVESTKP